MTKWFMTTLMMFAVLHGMGCGRADVPSVPDDAVVDVAPAEDPLPPGPSRGISDESIRQFIQEANKRLEDHVIQIAGLKFLGDAYFDPQLIEQLEEKLTEGQNNLRQIKVANMPKAKVLKGQLTMLLGQMDQLYELAMAETARKQRDADDADATADDQDALGGQFGFEENGQDLEQDDPLDDLEPADDDVEDERLEDSLEDIQKEDSFGDEGMLDDDELEQETR